MRAWAVAAVLAGLAGAAAARPADCFVEIDGLTVVNGPCDFEALADDGSFQVTTLGGGTFAQVLVTRPGEAEGTWNGGDRWASHAHARLGTLARSDACWSNRLATVCAW